MASTYKTFLNDDIVTARTLLHEAIPITGSIIYGTYGLDTNSTSEKHVKKFAHGMFQSVYDYPYLSSSANHIFDIAYGHHSTSANATNSTSHAYYKKRNNIYNQMAQILVGHDSTGAIRKFDADGDIIASGGTKYDSCLFFNFARLLNKDEIKKGSFEMNIGVTPQYEGGATFGVGTTLDEADNMHANVIVIQDSDSTLTPAYSATNDYRVNSPAGEYGILVIKADGSGALGTTDTIAEKACGLIYYQAGVVVLSTNIFVQNGAANSTAHNTVFNTLKTYKNGAGLLGGNSAGDWTNAIYSHDANNHYSIDGVIRTTSLDNDLLLNNIRKRIQKICFNNTTELNSTIYFCRINHNDFNYSSNPTYLDSSKIRVKNTQSDAPVSYITTIGLYSSDNELLGVAKLSEPLRKDPTNDLTLRVRLDY